MRDKRHQGELSFLCLGIRTGEKVTAIYTELLISVLLIGEASLPESQFKAFRRFVLDRFNEARKKVLSIARDGKGRPG